MANPTALNSNINPGTSLNWHYKLDALREIGEIIYFTNSTNPDGTLLKFNGISYEVIPCQSSGFGEASGGLAQRPKITLSDIGRVVSSRLAGRSIAGAKLYRYGIYAVNLDNGSSPNPNLFTPPDLYTVENMIMGKWGEAITWQLMSPHDIPNLTLPRRRFLRDKGFKGIGRASLR